MPLYKSVASIFSITVQFLLPKIGKQAMVQGRAVKFTIDMKQFTWKK